VAQHYDVTLKTLLRDSAGRAVHAATGLSIQEWLDIELPKVANPRMDLLGRALDGSLLHLELQVANDPDMPQRMAEYALGIYRIFKIFARQIVLYAGEPDLRMPGSLEGPRFSFSYQIVDLRNLDGEALLRSDHVGDNVLAILTRLPDQRRAVTDILGKIATLEATKREEAIEQLFILAGLRGLEDTVDKGIQKMATFHDLILSNKVLGREYKRGLEEGELKGELKGKLQGKLEGKIEGKIEGEVEGERRFLRRQLEKRFGVIPEWAEQRLNSQSVADLENLGLRLLDVGSLEELLR
jgi:predicted transposase YdaD